jgi:hypothetical protein
MSSEKLLIATPCYGGLVTDYYLMSVLGLTRLLDARAIPYDFRTISNSLVTLSRNTFASDVLHDPSFSHLMFIDADLGFAPDAVLRYLAFDKDVVCGVYPLKRFDAAALRGSTAATDAVAEAASYLYSSTVSFREDNQPELGFLRAEYGATGFMLIKRRVLEMMAEAYPKLRYRSDHSVAIGESSHDARVRYALFDTMISDERSLPEDYSFCKRWEAIGGAIWVDLESRFSHVGTHVFRGDLTAAIGEASRLGKIS